MQRAIHASTEAGREGSGEPGLSASAGIVGEGAAMREVLSLIRAVAPTPTTVLVEGESGVGKELVARAVHAMSERREGPFVRVNCGSIPRELFESEFFGHVRGAFTGAIRDRRGKFEAADGGTLFLDEVGEIPLAEQAKLLRVLQEREFERVGEDRVRTADVRIVAATNRRLDREVDKQRFRKDLYFRLSVFPIHVPPLRERKEDLALLAEHFLALRGARLGDGARRLDAAARRALEAYDWPGNVRELEHVIERSVILSAPGASLRLEMPTSSPTASADTLPPPPTEVRVIERLGPPLPPPPRVPDIDIGALSHQGVTTFDDLRRLEIRLIEGALERSGGRVSGKEGAAELLQINPSTLRDRIKALGIRRAGY